MRIIIATAAYPRTGASLTRSIATGLAARGAEVHVVCPSDQGSPRVAREGRVTVYHLRSMRWRRRRVAVPVGLERTMSRLIAKVRPDVVHTQPHFALGRAAIFAASLEGLLISRNVARLERIHAEFLAKAGNEIPQPPQIAQPPLVRRADREEHKPAEGQRDPARD